MIHNTNNIDNNTYYVLTNTNYYYLLFELGSESESSCSLSESVLFLGILFLLYGFPLAGPFPLTLLATDLSSKSILCFLDLDTCLSFLLFDYSVLIRYIFMCLTLSMVAMVIRLILKFRI